MNIPSSWWLVKLTFERVQTYLFAVPELRSMVGANTLLGEVLRGHLQGDDFAHGSLPAQAVACGSALPPDIDPAQWPGAREGDPLGGEDDPQRAARLGVLARDGGHLHAVFPDEGRAAEFIRQARALVSRQLPGLLLGARAVELRRGPDGWGEAPDGQEDRPGGGAAVADLPAFQVCMRSGQGPASREDERGRGRGRAWVAESVEARREAGRRFDHGGSHDVLGLLRGALLREAAADQHFPQELAAVARSGYVAVIHSDGNNIGRRSADARTGGNFFAREARGERFLHAMRCVVRKAFLRAVGQVLRVTGGAPPFRPLMLGGDDLLLVCDAPRALPFVVAYFRALRDAGGLPDGEPLYAAAGVTVVKEKFPFHRSHALAEQLAGSAKKLGRGAWAVDWVTFSEAWHDEVGDARRRDAVVGYSSGGNRETLILSRKPYRALGEGLSLEALLGAAASTDVPRSQLMALGQAVPAGRLQADWELGLLRPQWRGALSAALRGGSLWEDVGGGRYATAYLDFLELVELRRMGLAGEERP